MLTSEELFPPEYCFAGSCSSHLPTTTVLLALLSASASLSSCPSRRFPPFPLSALSCLPLAPFARRHCFNETGNVQFVRPVAAAAAALRCAPPLSSAVARRLLHACIRAASLPPPSPPRRRRAECAATPARNNFL